MAKHKLTDLERAEVSIQDFCERFSAVMTVSNAKGMWLCRCTRKNVQIFMATGNTLYACLMAASDKTALKRQELGV